MPRASHRIAPRSTTTSNGFGLYHDLIQSSGATTSRLGTEFKMALAAYHFGRLTLFERQLVGAEHRRDRRHIRRDGFEHYYLQVHRSGRMACGRPGEERSLAPGDAVLFDATQPMRAVVADADYVTVILARDLVEAAAPHASRLHGCLLPKGECGGIGDTVLALLRRAPEFSEPAAAGVGRIITSMLGQVEGRSEESRRDPGDDGDVEIARRMRAELFIDANLRADLTVGEIARRIGVSRSSLYRAFQAGGGIEATIVKRRAARLRSMISQPNEKRSIAALSMSVGFSSASHCSRAFQQIYGYSPTGLRALLRGDGDGATNALRLERMRDWYRTMNHRD